MFKWLKERKLAKDKKKWEQDTEDMEERNKRKRLGLDNVVSLLIIVTSSEDRERVEAAREELKDILFEAKGIKI
jgi:hypothetical protein